MTTLRLLSSCRSHLRASLRRQALPDRGPGAWSGGISSPPLHVEVVRSPKFLGEPQGEHAPPSDPGPVTHNRFSVASLLPSAPAYGVGFRATCRFRGSITRPAHSLCTLRPEGRPSRRNTRFQPGTTLCWTGFGPVGFSLKGFGQCARSTTSSSSPSPRLSLAHKLRGRGLRAEGAA